jgi:hypothetical protein
MHKPKRPSLQKFFDLPAARLGVWEKVWLAAPLAIWFSYQPLIKFGSNSTMNFELSITLIYALILALSGLPLVWKARKVLAANTSIRLVTAFVVLSGISVLWSANPERGVLTLGVIGLLYLIFLASLAQAERLQKLLPTLVRLFVASAVVMSILSLLQLVAGIWLGRSQTLLCSGCAASQFGFPRPNVFTIEPQFFGNLLLAPLLVLLHKLLRGSRQRLAMVSFLIIITALFLTLSRGAIFAFAVGAVVVLIFTKFPIKNVAGVGGLALAGFILCLLTQGLAATLNPRLNTSFNSAISASVNQLSLGVVDLRTKPTQKVEQTPTPSPARTSPIGTKPEVAPNFNGYVEQSTNVRVKLSKLAVRSWHRSAGRVIFGVGLGGSGVVLHREFPGQVNQHEIVQNEFAEVLLENGLLGLGLFVTLLAGLLTNLRQNRWAWAIVAAFVVQWNFFSGYPNSLHIYLILTGLLIGKGLGLKNKSTA